MVRTRVKGRRPARPVRLADYEADRTSAPAAMVIVVAVTDDANAPPMPYVPPAYVAEDHVPKCVTAVEPAVVNVNADEFVLEPDDAAFHEHA